MTYSTDFVNIPDALLLSENTHFVVMKIKKGGAEHRPIYSAYP